MALCDSCSTINFRLVGYHRGSIDSYGLGNKGDRDIRATKLNAAKCVFCARITQSFYFWILPATGSARERFDHDDTIVSVDNHEPRLNRSSEARS